MNIFFLDECPQTAAQWQCDKHIVKMALETAQLLCTTAHELGLNPDDIPYRRTHVNHPCAVWVRQSWAHYQWTLLHGMAICFEYQRRYGRKHKSLDVILKIRGLLQPEHFPSDAAVWTEPPQCMPDSYKVEGDVVQAYRNYYIGDKAYMAKWSYSETPYWWPA